MNWEITDPDVDGAVDIVAETRGEGNGWYEIAMGLSLADAKHIVECVEIVREIKDAQHFRENPTTRWQHDASNVGM